MIGRRNGTLRSVSGAGGSCFYRAIAYQLCERAHRPYDDAREVRQLRHKVQCYLQRNADKPIPHAPQLRWKELGTYADGYAEAPVPQAMAYVVRRPIVVHLGRTSFPYGQELPGTPLHVRLAGEHYSIEYPV